MVYQQNGLPFKGLVDLNVYQKNHSYQDMYGRTCDVKLVLPLGLIFSMNNVFNPVLPLVCCVEGSLKVTLFSDLG